MRHLLVICLLGCLAAMCGCQDDDEGEEVSDAGSDAGTSWFEEAMGYIANGNFTLARALIRQADDVNKQDEGGKSLLMQAAQNESYGLANELIKKGIDVELADSSGNTALHYAVKTGNDSMVELLLKSGASVDAGETVCQRTPLAVCLTPDRKNACKSQVALLLLKADASVTTIDCAKKTPILLAKSQTDNQMFLAVLAGCLLRGNQSCSDSLWNTAEKRKRGIDTVNLPFGIPQKTVLQNLAENGKLTAAGGWLKKLLDFGMDPSSPPYLLNFAVKTSNLETVQLLIDFGAALFAKSPPCQQTILMDCASTLATKENKCDYEMFQFLLVQKKADKSGRNCVGQTLNDIARTNSDERFIRLLQGTPTTSRPPTTPNNTTVRPLPIYRQCGWFQLTSSPRQDQQPANNRRRPKIAQPSSDSPQFPWMSRLSIFYENEDVRICGGSLINSAWILTAAHCVRRNINIKASVIIVKMGDNDGERLLPGITEQMPVLKVEIHPNFTEETYESDFALLKLSYSLTLNRRQIGAICLPDHPTKMCESGVDISESTASSIDGCDSVAVAGWGKNSDGPEGVTAQSLQSAELKMVSYKDCQAKLANSVFDSMLCAGSDDGQDACEGDSGGPLMCSKGNRTFVVGIVSHGVNGGCGRVGIPGVYSRVCHALEWIKAVTQFGFPAEDARVPPSRSSSGSG